MCVCSLILRYAGFQKWKKTINEAGGYDKFSRGYESFGFNVSDKGITYREWAPNVTGAYLYGDFSKDARFHSVEIYMWVRVSYMGGTEGSFSNHVFRMDDDNARWNR
jgi:1,4-alpha-glucan branching enzyme